MMSPPASGDGVGGVEGISIAVEITPTPSPSTGSATDALAATGGFDPTLVMVAIVAMLLGASLLALASLIRRSARITGPTSSC